MEFEVRHIGGIENCFVSLPLHLIQTLESTRRGFLPQILTLELRSASSDRRWTVSWSGATSVSPSIEISGQFAECILLLNSTRVEVRVVSNVERAVLVTIEPKTEDDWEVLELNAELAKDEMLKQVKVVYPGMSFPLWLHGRSIITYTVVSTSPDNVVEKYSLVSLHPVTVVPRIMSRDSGVKAPENDGSGMKSSSTLKEANNRISNDKGAIVHLLLSGSVAKGHGFI